MYKAHQNEIDIKTDRKSIDLENSRQDDQRPNHHHRRQRRKHLKETYWNSLQTYDMAEVKAYERLQEKIPRRQLSLRKLPPRRGERGSRGLKVQFKLSLSPAVYIAMYISILGNILIPWI